MIIELITGPYAYRSPKDDKSTRELGILFLTKVVVLSISAAAQ